MGNTDDHTLVSNGKTKTAFFVRFLILAGADALTISIAFLGAFILRFPYARWVSELTSAVPYLPLVIISGVAVFILTGMYRTLWRYASVHAAIIITYSTFLAVAVSAVMLSIWGPFTSYWSVFIIQWLLFFLMVSGGRFSIRIIRDLGSGKKRRNRRKVLIFGAGDAGEMIARDLMRSTWHNLKLVGFIDDDPNKCHHSIHSVPILGTRDDIARIALEKKVDEIFVAMPSLTGDEMRHIRNFLRSELNGSVHLKTVPGIAELLNGKVSLQQVRQFDVRDLLRRKPVELDTERLEKLVKGKSVLVSGAGGSIGAEICRQVAVLNPSRLILYDISEPSIYEIMEELSVEAPTLDLVPIVGDIASKPLLNNVFANHHPQIIFHAAAYKHVPLMEDNPWSAVINNVTSTKVLVEAAAANDIERFVMISTDKAVRPTSVMGATKRICEMMVRKQSRSSGSVFCVVRFGNVMGSSGSVIPKFDRQIKAGGPVTVTHPDMTRYFMLTSEAVQLVMQAATLEVDNAIYVLDMGEPVKIDDIAREMIMLSEDQNDHPIEIKYIGLRPGEKLREELYHSGMGKPTEIEKIWVADAPPCRADGFNLAIDRLLENCYNYNHKKLIEEIEKLVPDFRRTDGRLQVRSTDKIPSRTNGGRLVSVTTDTALKTKV